MQGTFHIIRPNGTEEVSLAIPNLETFQNAVGGYVTEIPMFEVFRGQPCVAYCNEDGEEMRLPQNAKATEHWHALCTTGDRLLGSVVVVYGDSEWMEKL